MFAWVELYRCRWSHIWDHQYLACSLVLLWSNCEFTLQSALLFLARHSAIALQGEALLFAVSLQVHRRVPGGEGGRVSFFSLSANKQRIFKVVRWRRTPSEPLKSQGDGRRIRHTSGIQL